LQCLRSWCVWGCMCMCEGGGGGHFTVMYFRCVCAVEWV